MFFLPKRKVVIECVTARPDVYEYAKPVRAGSVVPEWWRKLDAAIPNGEFFPTGTMRNCRGFTAMFSKGIIQPMWSDLAIKVENGNWTCKFSDNLSEAVHHPQSQHQGFMMDHFNMKLYNPWKYVCEEDMEWVMMDAFYNRKEHSAYHIAPGVANFKYQHSAHVQLMLPIQNADLLLRFHQPLFHLIPLTERKIELRHRLVSKDEFERIEMIGAQPVTFLKKYDAMRKARTSGCPFHTGK